LYQSASDICPDKRGWGLLINMVVVVAMVFNATFNNILAISWRPVLLVEETGEP
jgi:hypothetical protein